MAASRYNAYKNLILGVVILFFTLISLKSHYFPTGEDLFSLIILRDMGAETKATITNYKELDQGGKKLKYTYMVEGETYHGTYKLRGKVNGVESLVPVTYNLRQPQDHQYNLREELEYAEFRGDRSLNWKFYLLPISAFLTFYWGIRELRKLKKEARTQDADEG
jgi:hypothetical protein